VAGLEAQERDLQAAGCGKIFSEQVSSVAERQQLEAALDYVREGDSFTVTKLDRLARSVGDLLAIVAKLEAKGVSIRVLSMSGNQALDTSTSTGRLMLIVIGAVGQAERVAMLERQREGIARARAQGRYKGRVPTARRQAAERSPGSRRQASGPRKSPSDWGSAGPVCIGCWGAGERGRVIPDGFRREPHRDRPIYSALFVFGSINPAAAGVLARFLSTELLSRG
jgi:hypothetical protein